MLGRTVLYFISKGCRIEFFRNLLFHHSRERTLRVTWSAKRVDLWRLAPWEQRRQKQSPGSLLRRTRRRATGGRSTRSLLRRFVRLKKCRPIWPGVANSLTCHRHRRRRIWITFNVPIASDDSMRVQPRDTFPSARRCCTINRNQHRQRSDSRRRRRRRRIGCGMFCPEEEPVINLFTLSN